MFCRKCGTQIPDDVKFCTSCGFPIDETNAKDWGQETESRSMRKKCAHCGKLRIINFALYKLSDGEYVCINCAGEIANKYWETDIAVAPLPNNFLEKNHHKMTLEEFEEMFEKPELACKYVPEYLPPHQQRICGVLFDDKEETIEIGNMVDALFDLAKSIFGTSQPPRDYSYANLVKYEYGENQNIVRVGGSGVGRALVGGFLFGSAGAIVGATTKKTRSTEKITEMYIQMTFKIGDEFFVRKVNLMNSDDTEIKRTSQKYLNYIARGEKLLAKLDEIYCKANPEEVKIEAPSNKAESEVKVVAVDMVSEIRKYKQLLDEGLITEEEFSQMKKQLMGLV